MGFGDGRHPAVGTAADVPEEEAAAAAADAALGAAAAAAAAALHDAELPENDLEPPARHAELHINAKSFQGWRLSYRSIEPERHNEEITLKKRRKRHQLLGKKCLEKLVPGTRHASALSMEIQALKQRAHLVVHNRRFNAQLSTLRE